MLFPLFLVFVFNEAVIYLCNENIYFDSTKNGYGTLRRNSYSSPENKITKIDDDNIVSN